MESTKMSSAAKKFTTLRCFCFQRSKPASAASLLGELAITSKGIFIRAGFFEVADFLEDAGFVADVPFAPEERAREGATRGASPAIF